MDEKTRLIHDLDESRARMRAVLVDIDTEKEIYPGWTIKHMLAHITGWDDATIASLRAHAGGTEPGTPADRGIDFYNAQSVATRAPLPYPHIVKEWELARTQLKKALEDLPEAKLSEPLLFPWGATGTVALIIKIMVEHEIEHAAEIKERMQPDEPPISADP